MPEELSENEILEIRFLLYRLRSPLTEKRSLHSLAILVCIKHRIAITELMGTCRKRNFVQARIDFSHIAFRQRIATRAKISRLLKRDHSTISHHLKQRPSKIANAIEHIYSI